MINKKCKKMLCIAAAALCLMASGTNVFAATIPFDVTVGGTGTQDPLSRREIKDSDGDTYAYFRGATFSNSQSINVRSIKLNDNSVYTPSAAKLNANNAGITVKKPYYNNYAPGGAYYYMKSLAVGSRVHATGFYCP